VLIPAIAAICLAGMGIGALIQGYPRAFRDGRTTDGVVVSSSSCFHRFGLEIVRYTVDGARYRIVNGQRCDAVGAEVTVDYLPGDPADGRIVSPTSLGAAAVLFSLAGVAAAVGIGLSEREHHRRRRRW
jgi:hypothetical protein